MEAYIQPTWEVQYERLSTGCVTTVLSVGESRAEAISAASAKLHGSGWSFVRAVRVENGRQVLAEGGAS